MSADRIDFLVIGAQKAGTTALHAYLAAEPGVALAEVKEAHFFDDDSLDWERPDFDLYHRRFPAPDGRLRGEATPIYCYWPGSLERIADYNPDIRLVLMLRDPVARAWSHWKMEYARKAETRPFAWCVREGRQRLFQAEPWGHHRVFSYVERGFYGEQVERIHRLFSPDQTLILTAEALRARPAAAVAELRAFLGLAPGAAVAPLEAHRARDMDYGAPMSAVDEELLRQTYAEDDARLRELTGMGYG